MRSDDRPSQLLEICEEALALAIAAGADEAEIFAQYSDELTVGLEKNDLHQVRQVAETQIGFRVHLDGALGFSTSNQAEDLGRAAEEAVTLAKASPPDPLNLLPSPTETAQNSWVDPELETWDAEGLTAMTMRLLAGARAEDPRLVVEGGSVSLVDSSTAVVSSAGVYNSHRNLGGGGFLWGLCVDGDDIGSFFYDGDQTRRATELELRLSAAFSRFAEKCAGALGATKGESFRGPIVITSDALTEFLLPDLLAALSAESVRNQRSPLAGRLGESIAVDGLGLVEAGTGLPDFALCPFDREGLPRTATPLLTQGKLTNFLYNAYEARAAGCESSGHATGSAASLPRVGASCIQVLPGEMAEADLYAIERGLVVTRFSGSSDPTTGDFSGVVKGGFLLDKGERRPVDETTVAGNLYECLHQISGISREVHTHQGTHALPTIRIEDLSITAG